MKALPFFATLAFLVTLAAPSTLAQEPPILPLPQLLTVLPDSLPAEHPLRREYLSIVALHPVADGGWTISTQGGRLHWFDGQGRFRQSAALDGFDRTRYTRIAHFSNGEFAAWDTDRKKAALFDAGHNLVAPFSLPDDSHEIQFEQREGQLICVNIRHQFGHQGMISQRTEYFVLPTHGSLTQQHDTTYGDPVNRHVAVLNWMYGDSPPPEGVRAPEAEAIKAFTKDYAVELPAGPDAQGRYWMSVYHRDTRQPWMHALVDHRVVATLPVPVPSEGFAHLHKLVYGNLLVQFGRHTLELYPLGTTAQNQNPPPKIFIYAIPP